MIIDFHTHCFPDALAPRALAKLSAIAGMRTYSDGTVSGTIRRLDEAGIDRAVVLNIATNDHQTANVNRFAVETNRNPRLTALGSVNPESSVTVIDETLTGIAADGLPGIKIHPDYMHTAIDDPRFAPIFTRCMELDLFVVTHAGWDCLSPDFIHASPERIARVLDAYPKLKLVAAHLGGARRWDDVERLLIGRNVWLDTSLTSLFALDPAQMKRMLLAHDSDKLLFASDLPWSDPADALRYLLALNLPDALTEKILSQNALRLLAPAGK